MTTGDCVVNGRLARHLLARAGGSERSEVRIGAEHMVPMLVREIGTMCVAGR